jgi:hypothetical protein
MRCTKQHPRAEHDDTKDENRTLHIEDGGRGLIQNVRGIAVIQLIQQIPHSLFDQEAWALCESSRRSRRSRRGRGEEEANNERR